MTLRKKLAERFDELISTDDDRMRRFVSGTIDEKCVEDRCRVVAEHLKEIGMEELSSILLNYIPQFLRAYYSTVLQTWSLETLASVCMLNDDVGATTVKCEDNEPSLFETTDEEDILILSNYAHRSSASELAD